MPDRSVLLADPRVWEEACEHLMRTDRVMKRLIPVLDSAERLSSRGDAFGTLARSVIGQQVSTKSAKSIWTRFEALHEQVTPEAVLAKSVEELRGAGLSGRKVEYVQDLARHFQDKQLNAADWASMGDEEIIAELVAIRGIGRWTAEMFLMFHLMRPNVLPLDDAGLIKGISQSYFSGEPVSRSDAREVADVWAPWRTVGTWYIWRSLQPLPTPH